MMGITVQSVMPLELVERIDAARGAKTRSEWVREAAEAALALPAGISVAGRSWTPEEIEAFREELEGAAHGTSVLPGVTMIRGEPVTSARGEKLLAEHDAYYGPGGTAPLPAGCDDGEDEAGVTCITHMQPGPCLAGTCAYTDDPARIEAAAAGHDELADYQEASNAVREDITAAGGDPDAATVCTAHMRFIPCRGNETACHYSSDPAHVGRVTAWQRARNGGDA